MNTSALLTFSWYRTRASPAPTPTRLASRGELSKSFPLHPCKMEEMATATLSQFRNEPTADFSLPANRRAMQDALAKVRSEFGREYPLRISGEWISTGDKLVSVNPSNTREVVGVHHKATPELANRAVESASSAFAQWSRTPAEERVRLLLEASRILRSRKFEFDAWLVYEAGKTWPEADADVSEAIDFCEYYAREMEIG